MKTFSERSYGSRIGNAESLVAALQNFADYVPMKPEYSVDSFRDLIDETSGLNNAVAAKKQSYSLAVENRHQVFYKGASSIEKALSPINTTVKVVYGRSSKEAKDVSKIIAKIRGANGSTKVTTTSDAVTVSQSYQSYNSKAQFLADLIVYLTNFGGDYVPTNPTVNVSGLNTMYTNAVAANTSVMNSFTQFVKHNTLRNDKYAQLSQTAVRIKESIKAQYGPRSTEYRLVKGLQI